MGEVIKSRPQKVSGITTKIQTACGKLYITINSDENNVPFEVFCNIGKGGGCESSQNEAIGRLISLALRSGIDPKAIVKQLVGIRCNNSYGIGHNKIHSCSDAIAQVLATITKQAITITQIIDMKPKEEEIKTKVEVKSKKVNMNAGNSCPECGCQLEMADGCKTCRFCGYSKCG